MPCWHKLTLSQDEGAPAAELAASESPPKEEALGRMVKSWYYIGYIGLKALYYYLMKNGFKARVQFASFISTIDLALGITISQSLTVLAPISFCLGNVTHFFEANVDLRFRNLSAHNSHNPPFRRTLVWRFITFQLRWILLRLGDVSTWSSYIVYFIYITYE